MTTYDQVLRQTMSAYETLAEQQPDLVAGELDAGTEVTFTVDSDIGAVEVVVRVPAPLAPAVGQARVSFRPNSEVQVSVDPSA